MTITVPGNPPIKVALKRSARARRLSLRVSRLDGRVTLSLPARFPTEKAEEFLVEQVDWVRRQLSQIPLQSIVSPGDEIPLEGQQVRVELGSGKQMSREDGIIRVPGHPEKFALRLKTYLRQIAADRLRQSTEQFAHKAGRNVGKITLRDPRSRWGSCSAQGNLMFSWRLIMMPPEVLDYVAAHEVAHLVHMDHSAAFWSEVERICPGHKTQRQWLRQHGASFHRFNFD